MNFLLLLPLSTLHCMSLCHAQFRNTSSFFSGMQNVMQEIKELSLKRVVVTVFCSNSSTLCLCTTSFDVAYVQQERFCVCVTKWISGSTHKILQAVFKVTNDFCCSCHLTNAIYALSYHSGCFWFPWQHVWTRLLTWMGGKEDCYVCKCSKTLYDCLKPTGKRS